MGKSKIVFNTLILLIILLICNAAWGQQCVTKSGTAIVAAPRPKAQQQAPKSFVHPWPDPTAGTYIVVTRPDLLAPLQPLLQWKRQQGFRVETMVMTTNDRDSVSARLQHRYNSSTAMRPAQRYVLIVGDIDRIQGCLGRHTPSGLNVHNTDLYYGEYTGDYLPEALVGRLSVSDSTELTQVVSKIVGYEQGLWSSAHRALLVAGSESRDLAPVTTNGQVNFLAQLLAAAYPDMDTLCYRNPESGSLLPEIIAEINQANSLVNYTAHCITNGWNGPVVNQATIDTLDHDEPTIWVNNCCLSNAFNRNCFGEELLRRPNGGGAGVIGATNESLWLEDYYWAVGAKYPASLRPPQATPGSGAFEQAASGSPTHEWEMTLGGMNYNGCMAVTQAGSAFDAFYWEIYCLLGDPSMIPYWGSTTQLELTLPDTLWAGTTEIAVTGNLPQARVTATSDTILLGTACLNEEGTATLVLNTLPTVGHITITATAANAIFAQKEVAVVSPSHGQLALKSVAINGNTLGVTVSNVGQQSATGHSLSITQDSADCHLGATLPHPLAANITCLADGCDTLIFFGLDGYRQGRLPILKGSIIFANGSAQSTRQPFALDLDVNQCQLEGLRIARPDGAAVTKIYGNRDYLFSPTFSTLPDETALTINGEPLNSTEVNGEVFFAYHTPEDVQHLHLDIEVSHQGFVRHFYRWLLPYQATEDFESGTTRSFPWKATNLYPWTIDSTLAHEGRYSLRSAQDAHHSMRSAVTINVDALADDSVSFYYHVSSELHDWLLFYVDGRKRGYWSGNTGWQYYSYPLPAGRHELTWYYEKDASGSEGDDCAHIDDVRLPLSAWSEAYGRVVAEEEPLVGIETIVPTHFAISPNPSNGRVTLTTDSKPYDRVVEVYDGMGRKVDEIKIAQFAVSTQYSTHHLRFGIFTLVLRDKQNTNGKLIIKN